LVFDAASAGCKECSLMLMDTTQINWVIAISEGQSSGVILSQDKAFNNFECFPSGKFGCVTPCCLGHVTALCRILLS